MEREHRVPGYQLPDGVDPYAIFNDPEKINGIVNEIAQNPGEAAAMANTMLAKSLPETQRSMLQQAQQMASGGPGKQLRQMVLKSGLKPRELKQQLKNNKPTVRRDPKDKIFRTVILTAARKFKVKPIYKSTYKADIETLLGGRYATFVWKPGNNNTYLVFYNSSLTGGAVNKRALRLFNIAVGGDVLIFNNMADVTIPEIESLEGANLF